MSKILKTNRLHLVPLEKKDLDNILCLHSDHEVMKYIGSGNIPSPEYIKEWFSGKCRYMKANPGLGLWCAILKDSNEFIGWFCLQHLDKTDEVELGYRLHKKFWGKGLGTEGGSAVLNYGFKNLRLPKIIAIALPKNKDSIRVMEKLGFVFEKHAYYYGCEVVYFTKH